MRHAITAYCTAILFFTASNAMAYEHPPIICTPKNVTVGSVKIIHSPEKWGAQASDTYTFAAAEIRAQFATCYYKNNRTGYVEPFSILPKVRSHEFRKLESEGPWQNGPWSSEYQYRRPGGQPVPFNFGEDSEYCTKSESACKILPTIYIRPVGMDF